MKHINFFKYIFLTIVVLGLASCSSEDEFLQSKNTNFNDLTFVVNVNTSAVTRSATGKKDWSKGDKIAVAIDANDNNICILEYQGDGEWKVSQFNDQTNFNAASGKLYAVHADNLVYSPADITTGGDVLYTKNGTYVKYDNTVEINLTMNQRPVSRIAIVGVSKEYWIDGLMEYSKLKNLSSMEWNTEYLSKGSLNKEVYGDTCVFYGILNPDESGNTNITLINVDGATYKRTYTGKSVKAGDYIIIKGPGSSESDQWLSNVPVKSISANKSIVTLVNGKEIDAKTLYTINPSNSTNSNVTITSSNPDIVSVGEDGILHGNALGEATITVISEDGGHKCSFILKVINLTDYVTVSLTGTSIMMTSAGTYYVRTYTIKNDSDVRILAKSIATSNSQEINRWIEPHSSIDCSLNFRFNVYPTVTVTFTYDNVDYTISN